MNRYPFTLLSLLLITTAFVASCKKEDTPCVVKTWYKDADGDGKGDKNISVQSCEKYIGYVDNADDDNDVVPPAPFVDKGYKTPTSYQSMTLVWSDEFDGTSLNEKYWNYELGNNNGWGNNELEYYKKENTTVAGGYLNIEARVENNGASNYTSSRLTTQDKYDVKYGRIDIRALLPKGQGIWPALWMLGKNIKQVSWPKCGEIDIMELIGGTDKDNTVYGTAHWDNNNSHAQYGGNTKLASGIFNDEFHVFSIVWDAKKIVWYVDDKQFHIIDTTPAGLSEFQEAYFLLINLAVGGDWPGKPSSATVFPQTMKVDYVRVFQ